MTSELLDDYEEGTWTPTVGGTATYTAQAGYYIKVGRRVTIWGQCTINTIGTGSVLTVNGLPFSPSQSGTTPSGSVSYFSSLASSVIFITPYVFGTSVWFNGTNSSTATALNNIGVNGNSSAIGFTVTYQSS